MTQFSDLETREKEGDGKGVFRIIGCGTIFIKVSNNEYRPLVPVNNLDDYCRKILPPQKVEALGNNN